MREPFVSKLLKIALYVVFLGGTAITVTLPWTIDLYMIYFYDTYSLIPGYRLFIIVFMALVGVLGLWIVAELLLILRTIPKDPFIPRNVKALRRMGCVAVACAALFLLKCCLYMTFLTLIFGIFLLICSMFAFTLSGIFRQAVSFKLENDLTI